MTAPDESTRLECGRDLLDLVDQVTDGAPSGDAEHQASCPYCQEAIRQLRKADRQLRALAGEDVRVPRGLTQRVMAQLRRERGRVPIASGPGGIDTASDLVVLRVARHAARSVEGVWGCSVSLEPVAADGALVLTIHLTVALGPSLPAIADEVRVRVDAELRAITGLRAGEIHIAVDDVETGD